MRVRFTPCQPFLINKYWTPFLLSIFAVNYFFIMIGLTENS